MSKAIVLFSGPGGSSLGLRWGGVAETLGVEWDADAAATAIMAGLPTFVGDVRELEPCDVAKCLTGDGPLIVQASPPCPGFSTAGSGVGRQDVERICAGIKSLADVEPKLRAGAVEVVRQELEAECADDRSALTFEVVRWIVDLDPEYVMLEQVPPALTIWIAIGELLDAWGYSTWAGNVQAEQYGVPQTRKRAVLLASRVSEACRPAPTHSKYHTRSPERLDDGVLPWVTMAEALERGMTHRPSYTVTGGGTATGGAEPFGNGARKGMAKEVAAERWIVAAGITGMGLPRAMDQSPAPTVTGKGTAYWLASEADYRGPAAEKWVLRSNDQPNKSNGIRVTVKEAGILQSFPADYPWQGKSGSQYQQVGNAVPPLLQRALTAQMLEWETCVSEVAA